MSQKINIEFEMLDDIDMALRRIVEPLVKFVISNEEFLPCLCECILHFDSYEIYKRRKGNETAFDMWIKRVEDVFSKDLAQSFITLVKNVYESGSSDHKKLSRMRGMTLELLIYYFVYRRYNSPGCIISPGCAVKINDRMIMTEEIKTVDIAAWNGIAGEFYETKVRPENFDKAVMNYLALLYSELHKVEVKSVIGCVTMETKERLEKQLELITNGEKFYYCFGREELREIRDANFWNNIE